MDYHFVANKNITDIGGNIYNFNILLNLNKLEYFGLTIQQNKRHSTKDIKLKQEKEDLLNKLKENLYNEKKLIIKEMNELISIYNQNKSKNDINKKNEKEINDLNNLYIHIIKVLKLNLEENVASDIKELYNNKKINLEEQMLMYEKNETKCFDIDQEINKNFIGEKDIFFVKFLNYYKGQLRVKVCDYCYPFFSKCKLKLGEQLNIKMDYINFVTFKSIEPILYHFQETNYVSRINTEYESISDDEIKHLYKGCIVNVLLKHFYKPKEKNIIINDEEEDFWVMKIINYDYDKIWFIGLTLPNYKIYKYQYDFNNIQKVSCLYRFHKNNIVEKLRS